MPVLGLFVALGLVAAAAAPQIPPHPAILSHPEGLAFSAVVLRAAGSCRDALRTGQRAAGLRRAGSQPAPGRCRAGVAGRRSGRAAGGSRTGLDDRGHAAARGRRRTGRRPSGRRDRRPGRPDSDGGRFGAERDRSRLRLGGPGSRTRTACFHRARAAFRRGASGPGEGQPRRRPRRPGRRLATVARTGVVAVGAWRQCPPRTAADCRGGGRLHARRARRLPSPPLRPRWRRIRRLGRCGRRSRGGAPERTVRRLDGARRRRPPGGRSERRRTGGGRSGRWASGRSSSRGRGRDAWLVACGPTGRPGRDRHRPPGSGL